MTAGDLVVQKADKMLTHMRECNAGCEECRTNLAQLRLAHKIWQVSAHQTVSEG